MKVYIDGALYEKEQAKVSVFDHGFLYGDGVFEGIQVYERCIFKFDEHLKRLYDSAHSIMLNIPLSKPKLVKATVMTLKENKLSNAYLRIVVSRGIGDLGLDPRRCKTATVVIIADSIALYPEHLCKKGLHIVTVPTMRNAPEALNPQIKSLNYLNNILAKIEAIHAGVHEAIMLNHVGYVAECTGDNLIIVKERTMITPSPSMGALEGITCRTVLELGRSLKIRSEEKQLTRYDIFTADEVMLTGTAAEIIPVTKVDGRIIGSGTPGPITKQLMAEYKKIVTRDGVKY